MTKQSELTIAQLFHLEDRVRTEAERIRFRYPESLLSDPAVTSDMKVLARNERKRADDFDAIGNLLQGLQGDWGTLAPLVRAGWVRLRREFEALREAGREKTDAEQSAGDDAA